MQIKKNAWEVNDDEHALRALAGAATAAEFDSDRQRRAHDVAAWCSISRKKRGFEIGSGEGTVARILSSQCASLDCADISASLMERARRTCALCDNVNFFRIDNDYLDQLPSDHYDFGYSLNVFIHFNPYDIFNYLQSVRRILKPNGIFYFDACTIGTQTIGLFREHAHAYRQGPENIRGLLNFNDPNVVRFLVCEAGLALSGTSQLSGEGWLRALVCKSGEDA